jgi:hypothetical protein
LPEKGRKKATRRNAAGVLLGVVRVSARSGPGIMNSGHPLLQRKSVVASVHKHTPTKIDDSHVVRAVHQGAYI